MGILANKFKINLKAAILCLLISAAFWFFRAMNKHYTDAVYVPLNIIAKSNKHIKQYWVPGKIKVNATADGWYLLSRKLGLGLEPLDIELEKLPSCTKIQSNLLLNLLNTQYDDLEINYLYDDFFRTGYDQIVDKTVKVKVNRKKIKRDTYIVFSKVRPNQLKITGPSEVLDSLPNTIFIDLKELELGLSVRQKHIDITSYFNPKARSSEQDVVVDVELQEIHK